MRGCRHLSGMITTIVVGAVVLVGQAAPVACVGIQRTGVDQIQAGPTAGTDPGLDLEWYRVPDIPPNPHCGTCLT